MAGTAGRDLTLGGRVPAELVATVDSYAAKAGINRSEAMHQLIEAGLKRPPKAL
jgi:metal-responsive CopG/Arc/MetJ family transcriptional regulator